MLQPQVFTHIQITDKDKDIVIECPIGKYQVYSEQTSPDESIFASFSPFGFNEPKIMGDPFTVFYQIQVNPQIDSQSIDILVEVPDDYKDMLIGGASFSYNKTETDEYKETSTLIKNDPDNYINFKIYDVNITYIQTIEENIQIQPLIIIQIGDETFNCKPAVPLTVMYSPKKQD